MKSTYPLEIVLLLATCRLDQQSSIDSLLADLPASFNWTELVETAFAHGVSGLLCQALLNASKGLVPEEMIHASNEHLKEKDLENLSQANQLCFILNELNSDNIQAIPFKGLTLAMSAYGQINLRSSRDIDFLIREKDIQPCLDKLREIGYIHDWNLTPRQWQEFLSYAGEDILYGSGVPVEPHWAFTPSTLALKINYDAIWDRAENRSFNGQTVLGLSPEDELIVLCIHGCKEEWAKLKWVVDVAEFIRSHQTISWQTLMNRATDQEIARIVKIGISLALQMLGLSTPKDIDGWIKKDPKAVMLSDQLAEEFFVKDKTQLNIWEPGKFHWLMRERLSDRLRYLWRTISQPRVQYFADIAIPDSLFFLYWPYRLIHDFIALPMWNIIKKLRRLKISNNEAG